MMLDLSGLNLTANPFEDFELFEEPLGDETIKAHSLFFKNRVEVARQLLLGITTSTSYKVVLHGETGVWKVLPT